MRLLRRILTVLIMAAGGAALLPMAFPLPSFQSSVEFSSAFGSPVEVQCKSLDGKRKEAFQLQPTEHRKFIYFAGDHGGPATVRLQVEARVLSNSATFRRQLELPKGSRPESLRLSEAWFEQGDTRGNQEDHTR
jgi:hypothetical protein